MKRLIRVLAVAGLCIALLTGCKSSKLATVPATPEVVHYLSSKLQLTVPNGDGDVSANGTMKLKSGERVQLSVLMPILRTELMRIDVTPDEVLFVDRMNKRYVQATRAELEAMFSTNLKFAKLEKLLFEAAQPGGKSELTGKELGLPSLDKAKIKLYEFSDKEFNLTPTEISSKYTQVPLEVILKMLVQL